MELLKVLNFDCKLERFAEVFGDEMEMEDINEFLEIAPLTGEELQTARATHKDDFFTIGSPDHLFYILDMATQDKLNKLRQTAGLNPADLETARAFFKFINDAYLWDDLEDLERWEEALFNCLDNYHQKNYKSLDLGEDRESRFKLLCQYVLYLIEYYAELTVEYAIDTITSDIGEDKGRLWEFYQTHKKEEF